MNIVTGATTAIITPFKNGNIDMETYEYLIKRQIRNGIDAVCPVGTTGESATLNHNEHKQCMEIAVETCKGTNTKVLAGAGSNSTKEAIEMAKFAQKCGVDAIFSVCPYYNKPSQRGIYEHYKAISQAIPDMGLMLYNVPSRTGIDIQTSTIIKLFDNCENIYGIKEASGSLEKTTSLLNKCPNIKILSGNDDIDFSIIMNGGSGFTSVTSNLLPDIKCKLAKFSFAGMYEEALKINNYLYPINEILFCESNPTIIKAAMYVAGLIPTLEYRLPLLSPGKKTIKKIEKILEMYEVIK